MYHDHMEVYDDNKDGKIDIREMAQLLPMEENFLLLFRFDNPLDSSVEFMKVRSEKMILEERLSALQSKNEVFLLCPVLNFLIHFR